MARGKTYGRFSSSRDFSSLMDYAKDKGKERNIQSVFYDLQKQAKESAAKSSKVAKQQQWVKMGSSIIASILMPALITQIAGLGTAGAATTAATAPSGLQPLISNITNMLAGKGTTVGSQVLGKAGMGGLKLGGSQALSSLGSSMFNIKQPDAPTANISSLAGPGMSDALSKVMSKQHDIDTQFSSFREGQKKPSTLDYLMAFGGELMSPIKGLGGLTSEGTTIIEEALKGAEGKFNILDIMPKAAAGEVTKDLSIYEYFRDLIGLGKSSSTL